MTIVSLYHNNNNNNIPRPPSFLIILTPPTMHPDQRSADSPIHFEENVATVDVGLRVICPHGDGLSIQTVSLLESSFIPSNQVGQVQKYVEMIGSDPCLV